ncbi:hypothetical protein TWF481_009421 [Arthrobotrys musiformis]|uniref:Aminoglycoside phosphotransferase domain-containing protein n=1 Tax=Arthrobotrys musiformis TaxID=47236 RepID=A0AAV9W3M5_9PEZI
MSEPEPKPCESPPISWSSGSDTSDDEPPCLGFTDVNSENDDEVIRGFSDDELKSFIDTLRRKARERDTSRYPRSTRVIRTSQGYVTKSYGDGWIQDLKAGVDIARELGVRAPAIERILKYTTEEETHYECVQEYVPGANLMELFPNIDLQETIRLAFQLRGMLRVMHKKTNERLGSCHTLECRSYWLECELGLPRASKAEDIAKVVNFWHNYTPERTEREKSFEELERCCTTGPAPLDYSLVFTHHDLPPRNMVVGPDGELWLMVPGLF